MDRNITRSYKNLTSIYVISVFQYENPKLKICLMYNKFKTNEYNNYKNYRIILFSLVVTLFQNLTKIVFIFYKRQSGSGLFEN